MFWREKIHLPFYFPFFLLTRLLVTFQECIRFGIKWDWSRVRKIVKKERRCNKVSLVVPLYFWFDLFWEARAEIQKYFRSFYCSNGYIIIRDSWGIYLCPFVASPLMKKNPIPTSLRLAFSPDCNCWEIILKTENEKPENEKLNSIDIDSLKRAIYERINCTSIV